MDSAQYQTIRYEIDGKVATLTFNRPNKKNAISFLTYDEITSALTRASQNDHITVLVTTGAGDYYSSGNDLSNFAAISTDFETAAKDGRQMLEKFVNSFINFPKTLVAAVNGPAIGIACTLLGLYDAVFASDLATFKTPFASLGQSPEACASYTFPRIMGPMHAKEVLMLNKVLTAEEAKSRGLVQEVFRHDVFESSVAERVREISELPPNAMRSIKGLLVEKGLLSAVNKSECDLNLMLWQGEECLNAVTKFLTRGRAKL